MYKKIISISILIVFMFFTGCRNLDLEQKKIDLDAKDMINQIELYDDIFDKDIEDLQHWLVLSPEQAEILYLLKSDLLAKVPDVREMLFAFQLKVIELIEMESISQEDITALLDEINFYEKILKETSVTRLLELHATLSDKQKEKLAFYVDKGKIMIFPTFMPIGSTRFKKSGGKLYRELAFNREQKKLVRKAKGELVKLLRGKKKTFRKDFLDYRKQVKELILSESIQPEQIDSMMNEKMEYFADIKELAFNTLIEFHGLLTNQQKEVLVKFISEFN